MPLDLLGNHQDILRCVDSDVEIHYQIVKEFLFDTPGKEYKALMRLAIKDEHAFKLSDNSCFLYYIKKNNFDARGVSIFGKNNPIGILALMAEVFTNYDNTIMKITFTPHTLHPIGYNSIVLKNSIRYWQQSNKPLVVRVDFIRDKINKLIRKRLFSWAQ